MILFSLKSILNLFAIIKKSIVSERDKKKTLVFRFYFSKRSLLCS